MSEPSSFVPHPWHKRPSWPHDMLKGPCSCGAWHQLEDWTPVCARFPEKECPYYPPCGGYQLKTKEH